MALPRRRVWSMRITTNKRAVTWEDKEDRDWFDALTLFLAYLKRTHPRGEDETVVNIEVTRVAESVWGY